MVYATSLTLPAQIAAGNKLPVDEILRNLSTAALIPTRHGQKEAPTEPPAALASGDLVYVRKGGQLQPLAQPYSGPYKVQERGPKYSDTTQRVLLPWVQKTFQLKKSQGHHALMKM